MQILEKDSNSTFSQQDKREIFEILERGKLRLETKHERRIKHKIICEAERAATSQAYLK